MNIDFFIAELSRFIWPSIRFSGLFLSMPIFNSPLIPTRIKIILVMGLSAFCYFLNIKTPTFEVVSAMGLLTVFKEIAIGVMMGFLLQMAFHVYVIAGHIVAMQTGLGFATLVNPLSSSNVPLVSQFYLLLVSLIFLVLNGHLMTFELLIQSFTKFPIEGNYHLHSWLTHLIEFSAYMFSGAVLLAIPLILSLLTVNVGFGVMSRAVPQLNIISVGFPITLTLGLYIIYLTLGTLTDSIKTTLNFVFTVIEGVGI